MFCALFTMIEIAYHIVYYIHTLGELIYIDLKKKNEQKLIKISFFFLFLSPLSIQMDCCDFSFENAIAKY